MRTLLGLILTTLFMFSGEAKQTEQLEYSISFSNPHTHYAEVGIKISDINAKSVDFKMPVWTPGSYLVREFAKSVEAFEAGGLKWEKIDKNTWRVYTNGKKEIKVSYMLYAFERSVRTTYVDMDHAFLHNTSCFMYVNGMLNSSGTLHITPYKDWKNISTSLELKEGKYLFSNYDELADTPVEIGNHDLLHFEVKGVPHTVAMVGRSNCDYEQFTKDLKKICEEATAIVGEHPCKDYLFIIHNVHSGGGGLEHLNSTCVQMNRFDYDNHSKYLNFLGLCAHEYFHLWNVKRIRPVALGPFNYDEENYTHLLWVAEGITNYYDELIPARAGLIDDLKFLHNLSGRINSVENRKGNLVQSLAEASWDAWIKAYRPNENSMNTTVSYYSKGLVVASMLDILIANETNGEKHLDDLMRLLYKNFYLNKDIGFTDAQFVDAVNEICGSDQSEFFKKYVFSTGPIDYQKYLTMAGLTIVDTNKGDKVDLGMNLNKTTVTSVETGSNAYNAGISAKDEIIAVDGIRVSEKTLKPTLTMLMGKEVEFLISRDHLIRTFKFTIGNDKDYKYRIEQNEAVTEQQGVIYSKWMQSVK